MLTPAKRAMTFRLATSILGGLIALSSASPSPAADPAELMPGRIILLRPATVLKVVAKPDSGATFGLPGATNDPTVEGAVLEVFDESPPFAYQSFVLPAANWTALGYVPGSSGYRYRGAGSFTDPCKVVLVRPRVVKALYRGDGVTIAPPFSGEVAVVLSVGSDPKRYCASFGGTNVKNDGDVFKRKDANAPGFCPFYSPGSVTSTSTTTTSSSTVGTMPPILYCCAASETPPSSCYYSEGVDCILSGGNVSTSPCDGATGTCAAPPTAGPCCDFPAPLACVAGPLVPEEDCDTFGGTFSTGVCNIDVCEP